MIRLTEDKFKEAKAIAEKIEAGIAYSRRAGVVPSVTQLLNASRMNRLLDELYESFNDELEHMSHQWDGVGTEQVRTWEDVRGEN